MNENAKEGLIESLNEMINKKSKIASIALTTKCPLNCQYCSRNTDPNHKDVSLEWEQFLKIKDSLKDFEEVVICGIGEPFVYKYIYEAIEALQGKRVSIITSGTVRIDFERINTNKNYLQIIFSLDSPFEEGMRKITGNYNWQNLITNLSNINKYPRICKIFNCTVNENNVYDLPEIIKFAKEYNVKNVNFGMNLKKDEWDIFCEKYKQDLKNSLVKAREEAKKLGVTCFSSLERWGCTSNKNVVVQIDINGNVYPCCIELSKAQDSKKYGNIFESSFEEIWNSDEYKKFRTGSICKDGCTIYDRFSCKN